MSEGPEERWRPGISSKVGAGWVRRRADADQEGSVGQARACGLGGCLSPSGLLEPKYHRLCGLYTTQFISSNSGGWEFQGQGLC